MNTEFRVSVGPVPRESFRKACQICVAAKVKCTVPPGQATCERCLRLKKGCIFSLPTTRKRRRGVSNTRVEQLEEKLDSLVTLLSHGNSQSQLSSTSTHIHSAQGQTPPSSNASSTRSPIPPISSLCQQVNSPQSSTSCSQICSPVSDLVDQGVVTLADAEKYLHRYKTELVMQSPFVVIPDHIDIQTLRSKHPFIFLSLITLSFEHDHELQLRLFRMIKQTICQRIIMDEEVSLEILQGLLMYLANNLAQCLPKQGVHITRHIVQSLVSSLALDRAPGIDPKRYPNPKFHGDGSSYGGIAVDSSKPESWENARRRAFLGSHYVTRVTHIFRRHSGFLPHTKWVDQCSEYFSLYPECSTDLWIHPIMQISKLQQQVILEIQRSTDEETGNTTRFMIVTFEKELSDLRESITTELGRSNLPIPDTMELDLRLISIFIYESPLLRRTKRYSSYAADLVKLVQTTISIIDHFSALSTVSLRTIRITTVTAAWYSILTLPKVLLASTEGWDTSSILIEAGVDGTLARLQAMAERMYKSTTPADQPAQSKNLYGEWVQSVRNLVSMYQRYMYQRDADSAASLSQMTGYVNRGTDPTSGLPRPGNDATSTLARVNQGTQALSGESATLPGADQGFIAPNVLDYASWDELEWQTALSDFTIFGSFGGGPGNSHSSNF